MSITYNKIVNNLNSYISPFFRKINPITDQKIEILCRGLQKNFLEQESQKPAAGYCVTIHTDPLRKWKITPYGTRPKGTAISGFSGNRDPKKENMFCCLDQNRIVKVFKNSIAYKSINNQILVIPKDHYPHWFAIPLETQKELFRTILELRKDYNQTKKPIEFHCGSAAGQTVFHFHGETGIYV